MEEEDKDERVRKLGFKPQKENVYNKLLPYADKLDEESIKLFSDIKTNLIKSVLAREIRPGCALWTSRLNKYLKVYGLKFSKEDHIVLIKLFYSLLTIPNLEPIRINKFAATLSQLLKKRYLLSQDELQLEWRPLYDLSVRVTEKSKAELGMYKYYSNLVNTIENLIRLARVYFPTNVTQEILDEFRPKLCPFSCNVMVAISYLELFLPINVRPEDANIGYNLWFEEFMHYWEVCHNSSIWETIMASLMARLASKNMGYINWEPYIPIMFARFLRSLNLPVSFRQKALSKQYKIDTSSMCMWIISVLHKDSVAFYHLEKFMQTLETYLHPANIGGWTNKLLDFLRKLAFLFVQRIHCEREKKPSWETPIPKNYLLSDSDIDRFVNILKPCIQQGIFSKGSNDIGFTLQYLASLRPNIVIPLVLEKLYISMDSLTEPHKYTSSLVCLKSVTRYMVQGKRNNYPDGPTQVIPLLISLLPGIDPNDIRKCLHTFNVMMHIVNVVPLVNSSEAYKYYEDLTEEEHLICEASAGLEDFVLQFIDRLCVWVESNSLEIVRLEHTDSERGSRMEMLGETMIISVVYAILCQCSSDIYTAALKKIFNFASNKILETKVSGRQLAAACQGFVRVNPKEAMKLFMPHFSETVLRIMAENEECLKEERLDNELAYNLLILSECIDARGELVEYMDTLSIILEKTLHMRSLEGSTMAARMLHLIMSSMTIIQPVEYRSCNRPYNQHIKDFLTIREWGVPGNLHALNVNWYVPEDREINCIKELIGKYLVPEIISLEKYSSGEITLNRETLRRTLKIVYAALGSIAVLPLWEESALELVDSVLDTWKFELIVGGPYLVTMPDGRNVRKVVTDCIHQVQKRILETDEGDTNSIQLIVQIYDTLLFNRYKHRDFQMRWKSFHSMKKSSEDRFHQKKMHLRHVLIDRIQLHQEFRIESRCCFFTKTHRQILLNLFDLGVSRYSDVRRTAQNQLFSIVSTFPYSYTVLTNRIKEILQLDPNINHEKFKGCLHILIGPKGAPIASRHDWSYIKDIWPLIVKSQPSEKPSIVNLMDILLESIRRLFPTISIHIEIPQECIDSAYAVAKVKPTVDLTSFTDIIAKSEERLKETCNKREEAYKETLNSLIDAAISGKLHWRYHSMALAFIRELVHPDVKYSSKVIKYFLNSLISDSLIIRKIAIRVAIFILIQNKPKFKKVSIDPFLFSSGEKPSRIVPGSRPDNQWLMYDRSNLPKTNEQWENMKFVHNQYVGYYCWPKELLVFSPPSEQSTPAKRMDSLTDQETEIYEFFSSNNNVKTLVKYFSLEEKKGKDQFNTSRVLIFKNLFKIFEDKLLDVFLPHLQNLVADNQEQSQRCAAEIISGIIRGSKHWNFDQVNRMWSLIIPLVKSSFPLMSEETICDWVGCVGMALVERDPRSVHWFLEFLLDDPLSEQSSLVGCGRIIILQQALSQQPWRNSQMIHSLLKYFNSYLNHPFQNVRDKISGALTSIFAKDIVFSNGRQTDYPRIKDFFEQIIPKLDKLYTLVLDKVGHSPETDLNKIEVMMCNNHINDICKGEEGEWEKSIRLFKIVARYVINSIMQVNFSAVPQFYKLLPLAAALQSNDLDEELVSTCLCLMAVLSHCLTLEIYVPEVLRTLKEISECPFWSARACVPEFLQVFVFHNMATIVANPQWVLEIQNIVLELLEDAQPEVRTKASHILSDFLHCHFIPDPMDVLNIYKKKAKTKVAKRKIKQENTTDNKNAMKLRHAGVLGLCAFISSHPYDVPDFLADVFSELAPHLNDPEPIPSTIRKTLGNFKRTHHDNWETHKLKFTEEELSIISDLTVPPSYYA